MIIPTQLKGLRFCKVGEKDKVLEDKEKLKAPFESGWQNNPHTYDEVSIWMNSKTSNCHNYGIICGQEIMGLDDD